MSNNTERIYFKGLHALRFFAAALVLISHVEMIKSGLKVNNIYAQDSFLSRALENLGPMGVTFFFVLSGFLITYLLLVEKERTKEIAIKAFYWRRALRIWPIYIFFTLLVFYFLPQFDMFYHYYESPILAVDKTQKLWMYLLFFPGLVLALYTSIPWAGHMWSIGVEEQFYLVWPWVAKLKKRISVRFLMVLLLAIVAIKALFLWMYRAGVLELWIKEIIAQSKFECMIIGGLGALLLYQNKLNKLINSPRRNRYLLVSIVFCFLITLFLPAVIDDVKHLLLAPVFLLTIVLVAFMKNDFLEEPVFIALGNWSYGFYIYHMIGVVLVIKLMPDAINKWCAHNVGGEFLINLLYYLCSFVVTIIISAISYQLLETPFLKLKRKFAIVKSGKR